ncbi:MAG TPA: hypothetical protein VHA14_05795 [Bryobacteraceae bacterium]|nr:hypothetical protein [Bryobacteraceae bacterium]
MPQSTFWKFAFAAAAAIPLFAATLVQTPNDLTVHEWGTFTSVAGYDGSSLTWAPLSFTGDLPCFVHTSAKPFAKYNPGLVRMETPVVYFYTQQAMKASVHVDFPQGEMTEWYPDARVSPNASLAGSGSIDWADLNIQPGANPAFRSSKGLSRYYAARATDAAPVQSGQEREKLLFYRGVANFRPPIAPQATSSGYTIRNHSATPIPVAILFENHDGKIGYRVIRNLKDSVEVEAPPLTSSIGAIRSEINTILVQSGLYPKEAAAMLETWHDSWFETGTRVIYVDPRSTVDAILPIRVSPAPQKIERVFVGRVEVLSPWTETAIRTAMNNGDEAAIRNLGRFLPAFTYEMIRHGKLDRTTPGSGIAAKIDSANYNGAAPCIP